MPQTTPREIRQLIQRQICELQGSDAAIHTETLLIRRGEYCGHRFQAAAIAAVWFLEENQIKFYDADGHVLRTLSLSQDQPQSDAA